MVVADVDSTERTGTLTESRQYGMNDASGQPHNYIITMLIIIMSTLCQQKDNITVESSTSTVHSCYFNGIVGRRSQSRDDGFCGSTS